MIIVYNYKNKLVEKTDDLKKKYVNHRGDSAFSHEES